jgi:hypothetical protein
MSKTPPPEIKRSPEVYNYQNKFTLNKGDKVEITSKSYYEDGNGVRHRSGISGIYTFVCAVAQGILVRENNKTATIFVFLGEERKLELTGSVLKPHVLKLPKVKKKKP